MHINMHDTGTNEILAEYLLFFCRGLVGPRLRVKGCVLNFFHPPSLVQFKKSVMRSVSRWSRQSVIEIVCTRHYWDSERITIQSVSCARCIRKLSAYLQGRRWQTSCVWWTPEEERHVFRFQLFRLHGLFPQANICCHVHACFYRVILGIMTSFLVPYMIRL